MANETVAVNLVAQGTSWQVQFAPNDGNITVNAGDNDTINWELGSTAPAGAALTAVTISDGSSPTAQVPIPWSGTAPTLANSFTTTDQDSGSDTIIWQYSATVMYDNNPYTSDPEIKNDPPGTGMRMIHRRPRT